MDKKVVFLGLPKSENNFAEERQAICNDCEYYSPKKQLCKKCGCGMEARVTLKSAKCPIDKW